MVARLKFKQVCDLFIVQFVSDNGVLVSKKPHVALTQEPLIFNKDIFLQILKYFLRKIFLNR